MASTSSPYGLQVVSDVTGQPRLMRIPNGIASGYNTNIFYGAAVKLNASTGVLEAVSATTDKIYGVFAGCSYTPTGGDPRNFPFWAANATYSTNEIMEAYIIPGWIPGLRFQIQADGSVDQTALGSQFNLSNFTSGSTTTGVSACTAAASQIAASSQGQLVLHEFYPGVNSAVGDAYTDLIVSIAYPQAGNGYQTSIG